MSKLIDKLGIAEIGDSDSRENNFIKFVNEFYKVCHAHQITPTVLASWFNDLVEFSVESWDEDINDKEEVTPSNSEKEYSKTNKSVPIMTLISRHLEKKKNDHIF